jgi:hypothetical protein
MSDGATTHDLAQDLEQTRHALAGASAERRPLDRIARLFGLAADAPPSLFS